MSRPKVDRCMAKRTRGRAMDDAPGHDRISKLPDPILGHILSLMPAKEATQTAILSKRWRHLWEYIWCSATTLDFAAEFAARQTSSDFVRNVNRYLKLHRGKKIQRFLVALSPDWRFFRNVKQWLEFAAAKDVEEISLEFKESYHPSAFPSMMPKQLFDCVRLRVLRLRYCSLTAFPDFARLRSLTSLSLDNVDVTSDDIRNVIAECRLLERLLLIDCWDIKSIKLTSPHIKLKQLVLGGDYLPPFDLEISARSLRSFHFFGQMPFASNSFSDVAGLVDAFICPTKRPIVPPLPNYVRLLSDLANVEILTINSVTLVCVAESLPEPGQVPLPLRNLRELQLLMDRMSLEYLPYICDFFKLCHLPLLERLFVRLPEELVQELDYFLNVSDKRSSAVAQFNQLKVIKVHNFKGSVTEMALVRFLLLKTPVLELLVLVVHPELRSLWRLGMTFMQRRVVTLPRVSRAVEIVICELPQDDDKLRATHNEHTFEWAPKGLWGGT